MAETVAAVLIEAGVSAGVAGAVGSVAAWAATAAASYALSQALAPKARSRDADAALGSTTVSSRAAAGEIPFVYGRTRVAGNIVYQRTTNNNSILHLVIALAGHQLEAIEEVWINDTAVLPSDLDASGFVVSGKFSRQTAAASYVEYVQVGTTTATISQTPSLVRTVSVLEPGADPQLDNYGSSGGVFLARESASPTEAGYTQTNTTIGVNAVYAGLWLRVDYETGFSASPVRIHRYLGNQLTADADLVAACGDEWLSTNIGRDIAYLYVLMRYDRQVWATGAPNITAVVKGRKVFDPRTGTTAWSNNPALCLSDYLTNTSFGLGVSYATRIDEAALITAANICDESVSLAAGGTEKRFTCDAVFSTSEAPKDIITAITGAMAGYALRAGARWRLIAGAYVAPTVTLDESAVIGPMSIQTLLSRNDVFSAVKGTFVSLDTNFQPDSYPSVTSATYDTEDGGRVWGDLPLRCTQSPSMAQRIARIALRRARQQISVTMACALTAFRVQVGDTVTVTNARMGWAAKAFFVQGVALSFGDDGAPVVNLTLRETSSTIYDWTPGTDELDYDPAPNTDIPFSTLFDAFAPHGTNMLYNSNFPYNLDGWAPYAPLGGFGTTVQLLRNATAGMHPAVGDGVLELYQSTGPITTPTTPVLHAYAYGTRAGASLDGKRTPVRPGQRYEVSGLFIAHRCKGAITVNFTQADGVTPTATGASVEPAGRFGPHDPATSGAVIGNFLFAGGFVTAPPGAAWATVLITKTDTLPTFTSSYLFATRMFMAEADPDQQSLSPWAASIGLDGAGFGALAPSAATEVYAATTTTVVPLGVNPALDPFSGGVPSSPGDNLFNVVVTLTEPTRLALHLSGFARNDSGVNAIVAYGFSLSDFDYPFDQIANGQTVAISTTKQLTLAAGTWTIHAQGRAYQLGAGTPSGNVNLGIGLSLRAEVIKR